MAKKRTVRLALRVTPATAKVYEWAAKTERFETLSAWMRRACDDRAAVAAKEKQ